MAIVRARSGRWATILVCLALCLQLARAFEFFGNFFGQQQQQHQHQQEQDRQREARGQSSNSNECLDYKCPTSKQCVAQPSECPCPTGETKCPLGDWYSCATGLNVDCDKYLAELNPQFAAHAAGAAPGSGSAAAPSKDEL